MAIASLDSVIRRSWSPETSVWRLIAAVLLVMLGTSGVALAQVSENYIVQFHEGTSAEARAAVVRGAGAALGVNFGRVNAAAVRVPNANALTALVNNPFVRAVVPNRPVFAYQHGKGKPGGGGGGGTTQVVPAGVARVGRPTSDSNGLGVGVAVIDTGVDLVHPDLAGTVDAFNAFGTQSCQDDEGHGTHVAGIIAARDNDVDVIGVAPEATIYCVKVLDSTGSGSDANVMSGLEWVLDHASSVPPIKVVNMSLGRPGAVDDNPAMHQLMMELERAGLTVVVAAGNDPTVDVSSQIPAAYPEVFAVASTTALAGTNQCRFLSTPIAADTASYFTTDGTGVIVSAPGEEQENVSRGCFISSVGILSTRLGGGTTRMSGTSMASPHVAGVAARYYQAGFKASDIRQVLQLDADRVGTVPLNSPSSQYTTDGEREGIVQAP
jgi:subtilisin